MPLNAVPRLGEFNKEKGVLNELYSSTDKARRSLTEFQIGSNAPSVLTSDRVVQPPVITLKTTFNYLTVGDKQLDYCYYWEKKCSGKPAADVFCRVKGYSKAVDYGKDYNAKITYVFGDRRSCQAGVNHSSCWGFTFITCST